MRTHPLGAFVAIAMVATACGSTDQAPTPPTSPPSSTTSSSTTVSFSLDAELERFSGLGFAAFLDTSYAALAVRSPQAVTSIGLGEELGIGNGQLDDLSDTFIRQTQELETAVLETLRSYDRSALTLDEQTSYDVYEWHLDVRVRGHQFMYHDYPISYFLTSYNQTLVPFLTDEHPLQTVGDAEDYVARLGQIGRQIDQVLEGLEIRRSLGITPPGFVIDWTIGTLEDGLSGIASSRSAPRPQALPLYTSFQERLDAIEVDQATKRDLLSRAETAIKNGFVSGWKALIDHLQVIRSEARDDVGVWALPDGDAYYTHLLRHHTTTEMTADEIHELGIAQVERVQSELRAAFDHLGYPADDDLGSLRARARRDGGFLDGDTPEREAELLAMYGELIDVANREGENYFSTRPSGEMIIVPERVGRGGYYIPGSADGSRPGAYHAGIQGHGLSRYTLATTLYHEAVPGHHFQIALAQELDLPSVRRFTIFTAYVEGWALYAERLAGTGCVTTYEVTARP